MSRMAHLVLVAAFVVGTPLAHADGDIAAGEKIFKSQCITCHTIGKGERPKTGPNLFDVYGQKPAHFEGYRYSKSYPLAADKGAVWNDVALDEYLDDPLKFIRKASDDPKGQTKMTFNVKKEKDRADVIAYLKTQK
ncbi:MAG: c-type cytochrome [Rhodospirillales bacterium]|nr:c-type cytochrome [Rhodospirillales bacterium]